MSAEDLLQHKICVKLSHPSNYSAFSFLAFFECLGEIGLAGILDCHLI